MPDKGYYEEIIREAGDLDPRRLRDLSARIAGDGELSEREKAALTQQLKHLFDTLPLLSIQS